MKRLSDQRGYTVVELMVVISIIGVMVGIVVGAAGFSVAKAKTTSCRANLRVVRGALGQYSAISDGRPETIDALVERGFLRSNDNVRCPASGIKYDYQPASGEVKCQTAGHESF